MPQLSSQIEKSKMFIKSFFKYQNECLDEKEYKKFLQTLTNMDLRRISKFNLLSIYGSLNCLKGINFSRSCSIYITTNSGCVDETFKVLCELKENNPVMPFDFLNINTNNTGFYISKALDLDALNYTISSNDLSFERAFELAFYDYQNSIENSFLIGFVESSSKNIPNQAINSLDCSSWVYFDSKPNSSISKIEEIKYFANILEINDYLKDKNYENIVLNSFTKEFLNELNLDKNRVNINFDIFSIFEKRVKNCIYIALDSRKKGYLFLFK